MLKKDPPVYLLAGSEQFLKEQALAKIKSTFLDKDTKELNFNVFYPDSVSAKEILECLATAPFLGQKRLVLVRQIEKFPLSDQELILAYVSAPKRYAVLVLETQESNLTQKFFAEICKYAKVISCNSFDDNQIPSWIKSQVKASGKDIEDKARGLLVDNLGKDLQLLSNALNNLILYIGDRRTIELSDVEKLVGPDLNTTAFELFKAITFGDKKKTFQILDSLLKDGIGASQILGALAHKIISEKSKLDTDQVETSLQKLQTADADIKTGRQGQKIALELLAVELLNLF